MDLSPTDMKNYTSVTQEEFELFINKFAPETYRTAHTGGENYYKTTRRSSGIDNKRTYGRRSVNKIVATHIIESGYYVHNDFIKGE